MRGFSGEREFAALKSNQRGYARASCLGFLMSFGLARAWKGIHVHLALQQYRSGYLMVFGPDMGSEWIFDGSLPWEAIGIDIQWFLALRVVGNRDECTDAGGATLSVNQVEEYGAQMAGETNQQMLLQAIF